MIAREARENFFFAPPLNSYPTKIVPNIQLKNIEEKRRGVGKIGRLLCVQMGAELGKIDILLYEIGASLGKIGTLSGKIGTLLCIWVQNWEK